MGVSLKRRYKIIGSRPAVPKSWTTGGLVECFVALFRLLFLGLSGFLSQQPHSQTLIMKIPGKSRAKEFLLAAN